jgi:hypothetical protein
VVKLFFIFTYFYPLISVVKFYVDISETESV